MRPSPGFLLRSLVPLAVCAVVACGGSTTSDLFQDASTGDAAGQKDGGTKDSGGGPDARPDVGPPPNCNALINDVANKRDKALECNAGSSEAQCNALVPDLCCPISVTDPTRKDVQEFAAAVEAVKKSGCSIACPAIPCPSQPSGKCDAKTGRCL